MESSTELKKTAGSGKLRISQKSAFFPGLIYLKKYDYIYQTASLMLPVLSSTFDF